MFTHFSFSSPDPNYCAMCVSQCGVVATIEDGILQKVHADPEHPNGCICVKGTAAPEIVYSPDRLRAPMVRTRPKGEADPGWVRIAWDEALTIATSRLLDIKARYGPVCFVPRSRGLTLQRHLYAHVFKHKELGASRKPLTLVTDDRKPAILHRQILATHPSDVVGLNEHGVFSCGACCILAHMYGWEYPLEEDFGPKVSTMGSHQRRCTALWV
jgi:hypothetical protein